MQNVTNMRFLIDIAILLGNIQFEEIADRIGHKRISYAKRKNCTISYEICNLLEKYIIPRNHHTYMMQQDFPYKTIEMYGFLLRL